MMRLTESLVSKIAMDLTGMTMMMSIMTMMMMIMMMMVVVVVVIFIELGTMMMIMVKMIFNRYAFLRNFYHHYHPHPPPHQRHDYVWYDIIIIPCRLYGGALSGVADRPLSSMEKDIHERYREGEGEMVHGDDDDDDEEEEEEEEEDDDINDDDVDDVVDDDDINDENRCNARWFDDYAYVSIYCFKIM
jgi:ABC-type multidrug transport system fused ATPase/permease subunit